MARHLKPPAPVVLAAGERSVFLAGSIDQGNAVHWQDALAESLGDLPAAILNPRRDAWDASWDQSIHNPPFREQVEWELDGLERADVIAMYFAPNSRAPITLLELGLTARGGKVIACCPPGFWRRGNVEVVAAKYGIETADDLPALAAAVRRRLAR